MTCAQRGGMNRPIVLALHFMFEFELSFQHCVLHHILRPHKTVIRIIKTFSNKTNNSTQVVIKFLTA